MLCLETIARNRKREEYIMTNQTTEKLLEMMEEERVILHHFGTGSTDRPAVSLSFRCPSLEGIGYRHSFFGQTSCLPYFARQSFASSRDRPIFSRSFLKMVSSSCPSSCPSSTIIFACPCCMPWRTHFSDSVSIIVPPITFTSLSSFLFPLAICVMIVFTKPIRSIISASDSSAVPRRRSSASLK